MATSSRNDVVFWRDFNPYFSPMNAPTASSPHILIIGGGVIGLVNAWVLLDRGYKVTILSKEWASYGKGQRLTSQIAGALWEYPPAVCGTHTDKISLAHSRRWCMQAYRIWEALADSPELSKLSGVRMKPADFFFKSPVRDDPAQLKKMLEIMASGVRGFRHDSNIIKERGVSESYGAVDAYEHIAPVIDTDAAMKFLNDLVTAKGARMMTREIHGRLLDQEQALRKEFKADIIINATGNASAELAGDEGCYPLRGGLIRVINDGKDFPKVEAGLTISADAAKTASEIVFLVPRNDNILLIGGITQANEKNLDLTLDTPIIKRMRARCEAFLPGLKNARLDPEYPLAQGLRPNRKLNVRVERELGAQTRVVNGREWKVPSRIVHSYGQGGAGWSLSFGCAADVAGLVEEALLDLPPIPMRAEEAPFTFSARL